jgi:serine/threonine protein phosphatase PrpC
MADRFPADMTGYRRVTLADRVCGCTHPGGRPGNEDNLLAIRVEDSILLAVADGLGGHAAGEVASGIAVDTLAEVMRERYRRGMSDGEMRGILHSAYLLAHERIRAHADGEREGMGTTLVSASVRGRDVTIAHTGDSRAYIIGDSIRFATQDHSLVSELVGKVSRDAARRHPLRNIVTRALGVDFGIGFHEAVLDPGDTLILSSDGFHDYVDDALLVKGIVGDDCESILSRLMDLVMATTQDNITIIIYR